MSFPDDQMSVPDEMTRRAPMGTGVHFRLVRRVQIPAIIVFPFSLCPGYFEMGAEAERDRSDLKERP
uniref:Uncharacterized protein n=1 Tax=Picea sitchensis TaxID=3332 RepID=A0A6B9XVQ4_PICSI|nr:hypothetical protein Q903MT_gene4079 [Picea sitchensis]